MSNVLQNKIKQRRCINEQAEITRCPCQKHNYFVCLVFIHFALLLWGGYSLILKSKSNCFYCRYKYNTSSLEQQGNISFEKLFNRHTSYACKYAAF